MLVSISIGTQGGTKQRLCKSGLWTPWQTLWAIEKLIRVFSWVYCTVPLKPWRSVWWMSLFLRIKFLAQLLRLWRNGWPSQVNGIILVQIWYLCLLWYILFYDSISPPPTDHARQISKSMMRKSTIDKLLANREADTTNFVSFITKDSIQKSLGVYMEMLKKRRSWGPKHVLVVDVAFMELISVTVYHTVLVLLLGGNFVCK